MSFWNNVKRVGTGLVSGGLSEAYRYGKHLADDSASTQQKRTDLNNQGGMASVFGDQAQQGYGAMTGEASGARDRLRALAEGRDSLSSEQLRQGLGQQLATQRSFAASAAPQDAAMAARTAMMNMNRANTAMAGNAAMAGIAERQAAQKALMDSILSQRQQDAQVALGSRQNAVNAFGGVTPEASFLDKWAAPASAGLGVLAKSDRRAKQDIKAGDDKAKKVTEGLKAFSYKYKSSKDGDGEQFGIMAQDLERAGLRSAVIDTPSGKYVNGAKAATASLGLVAALGKRVAELEKQR